MTAEVVERLLDVYREQPAGLARLVVDIAQVLDDMGDDATLVALRGRVFAARGTARWTDAWEHRFARALRVARAYGIVDHDADGLWWATLADADVRLTSADVPELVAA